MSLSLPLNTRMSLLYTSLLAAGAIVGAGVTIGLNRKEEKEAVQLPSPLSANWVEHAYRGLAKGGVVDASDIGPVSDLLVRHGYIVGYDRRHRIPAWTAEHLTAERLGVRSGSRAESVFKEDMDVPGAFRASLLDYFRSGYDRGHMVPAADAKSSQEAMNETFLLTNIAPQVGEGFNRHYWAYVESWCRHLTREFEDVYVFTVPLFLPLRQADGTWRVSYQVIGPQGGAPNVSVPTHFAKVVLASKPPLTKVAVEAYAGQSDASSPLVKQTHAKELALGAFVLPNAAIPDETRFDSFQVPVEAVERAAGLFLVPDHVKERAKALCRETKCQVEVRRFDDAVKRVGPAK